MNARTPPSRPRPDAPALHAPDGDPLLEHTGSHPIGAAIGAVGGALTGALLGIAAGPVGSLTLGVAGAIAGGVLGAGGRSGRRPPDA